MDSTVTSNKKQRSHWPLPKQKKAHDEGPIVTAKKQQPSQPRKNKKRKANNKEGKQSSKGSRSSSKRAKKPDGNSPSKDASTKDAAVTGPSQSTAAIANNNNMGVTDNSRHNRIGYMGVTFHSRHSKYEARTRRGSREYKLGLFDLACDAALAYDAAYRITGGGGGANTQQRGSLLITNDIEEIKYALNWIDYPVGDNHQEEKDNEPVVNFTAPCLYREARRKEIGAYLTGSIHYPTFDLKNVPQEEELKMQIKNEILNLAKAYVLATQQGLNNDQGSDTISDSNDEKKQEKGSNNKEKAVSSLLKKKTWVPEETAVTHNNDEVEKTAAAARQEQAEALLALQDNATAAAQARQAQAEALLALQKKRHNETKKEALAQKLEKIMNGNGGGAVSFSSLSSPPQDDQNKGSGSAMSASSSFTAAAVAGGEGYERTTKSPEEKVVMSNNISSADKDHSLNQLLQQQQQQAVLDNWRATGGEGYERTTKSPEETIVMSNNNSSAVKDDSLNHLQLNQLQQKQQAALDNWRAAATGFCSSVAPGGTTGSGLPFSRLPNNDNLSNNNNSMLEQVLMINENAIRHALKDQQGREAATMMRAAQIQASLLASGGDGQQSRSPTGVPSLSPPFGLQQPGPVLSQSRPVVNDPPHQDEAETVQPEVAPSSNAVPQPSKLESTVEDYESSETSVADLLTRMGHRGPIPLGLVEHLQAVLKEQQQQHGQQQGMRKAAIVHEHGGGGGEDPQVIMQRQLANEAKKTALARKLSALMTGQGISEVHMENDKEFQVVDDQFKQGSKLSESPEQHFNDHDIQAGKLKHKNVVKKEPESDGERSHQQGDKEKSIKEEDKEEVTQPRDGKCNVPEHIASFSATPLQQPSLQTLQAPQCLSSGEGLPEGIDEQTILQSLMLKKKMEEMNKQALEHKVQAYIQGKGLPQQPNPQASGLNRELSQNIALQSLLQLGGGGAQQSLLGQPSDLARQTAIQTLLANHQGTNNQISEALTHDVVHRRLVIESMLRSEENRLRQLREALQSQFISHPQQLVNQMGGGGYFGGFGGSNNNQFNTNPHHELMHEREQRAMNDEFRRAMLTAEINASTVEQQSQEMALRQALVLQASQGADISPERLMEAARNRGLDPQTMTPGQLSQLMGMAGRR